MYFTVCRFLEYCQVAALSSNEPPRQSYESELSTLHEMVQQSVSALLTDPHNVVKQTLIENGISKLCVFFGKQKGELVYGILEIIASYSSIIHVGIIL